MVTEAWRCARLAVPLGMLLFGASACSSFDPVKETRFTLLLPGNIEDLGIEDAHWVAYDDQHSLTSACTNGAAGNHKPEGGATTGSGGEATAGSDRGQCSLLYKPQPKLTEAAMKCPNAPAGLNGELEDANVGAGGSICVRGLLRPLLPCPEGTENRCKGTTNGGSNLALDQSNMWGAGVGFVFSKTGNEPWNASEHGVTGVAFDLSGVDEPLGGQEGLNIRVEIPILLDAETTKIREPPLMRSDGAVIGTDYKIHSYDCSTKMVNSSPPDRKLTGHLSDLLVGAETGGPGRSALHPLGSPFWQEGPDSKWVPSPIKKVGHIEFSLDDVLPPLPDPDPPDTSYDFDRTKILGIHFHVVHFNPSNPDELDFSFCIENLAFLR